MVACVDGGMCGWWHVWAWACVGGRAHAMWGGRAHAVADLCWWACLVVGVATLGVCVWAHVLIRIFPCIVGTLRHFGFIQARNPEAMEARLCHVAAGRNCERCQRDAQPLALLDLPQGVERTCPSKSFGQVE